jgi:hypothetical protein
VGNGKGVNNIKEIIFSFGLGSSLNTTIKNE